MGKFELAFVEDREYKSQLDYDMDVLSATVVYLCKEYENIFSGWDGMMKAINEYNKRKTEEQN